MAIGRTHALLGNVGTPIQANDVPVVSAAEWHSLTDYLSGACEDRSQRNDASLLVWTRGFAEYGGKLALTDAANYRLLQRALSVGIRSNAFIALCEYCKDALFDELGRPLNLITFGEPLGLYFKYIRLLKRRGRFTQALGLLCLLGTQSFDEAQPQERRLNEARVLLTVAKALGSHQSRQEQCLLLARLACRRAEALRHIDELNVPASSAWLRSVDAICRYEFELKVLYEGKESIDPDVALFTRWQEAADLDLALGNRPSRAEFSRTAALFSVAKTSTDRARYRKEFLSLLKCLSRGNFDARGLSIRHIQYARILLDVGAVEDAQEQAQAALKFAELVCDWNSTSRALLLQAESIASQVTGTRGIDFQHVSSLLERGKYTLKNLEEQPLPLLLSYCRDQARQYLLIGDTRRAIMALEEALSHVSDLRRALHVEQEQLGDRRARARRRDDSPWQFLLAGMLTERENFNMRLSLVGDWKLLSQTQENLTETLKTANQIAHRRAVYEGSAGRADSLRIAIYHNIKNVLAEAFKNLCEEVSTVTNTTPEQMEPLLNAIHTVEDLSSAIIRFLALKCSATAAVA